MRKSLRNVHGSAVQSKTVKVHVTADDVSKALCRNPNKCMIKVAVKRALNLAHGYIHVDATGVSISRNGSYREKAFLPKSALVRMLAFDNEIDVKPFAFKLNFHKTSKVIKLSRAQREEYTVRAKRNGAAKKRYDMRSRVIGVALSGGGAVQA